MRVSLFINQEGIDRKKEKRKEKKKKATVRVGHHQ